MANVTPPLQSAAAGEICDFYDNYHSQRYVRGDLVIRVRQVPSDDQLAALNDEFFIKRKLYPNVDFYSGVIYEAIGIPIDMFTVMFTMGRLPGWIAQWMEMRQDPDFRIGRPRQVFVGPTGRSL